MKNDTKLSRYFSLEELTHSENALRLGIKNTPTPGDLKRLKNLAEHLDKIREAVVRPVLVSSGYRSPALNAVTPGSSNSSQHMIGEAADIKCPMFGPPALLMAYIQHLEIPFDQMIVEYADPLGKAIGGWLHYSVTMDSTQRKEVRVKTSGVEGYPLYTKRQAIALVNARGGDNFWLAEWQRRFYP